MTFLSTSFLVRSLQVCVRPGSNKLFISRWLYRRPAPLRKSSPEANSQEQWQPAIRANRSAAADDTLARGRVYRAAATAAASTRTTAVSAAAPTAGSDRAAAGKIEQSQGELR